MPILKEAYKVFSPIEYVTQGDVQNFEIIDGNGNVIKQLNSEAFDGNVFFELSKVLQAHFADVHTWLDYKVGNGGIAELQRIVTDKNLAFFFRIRYKIDEYLSEYPINAQAIALNAVAQIGENNIATPISFLTGFKRQYMHNGYELSVAFLGANETEPAYLGVNGDGFLQPQNFNVNVNFSWAHGVWYLTPGINFVTITNDTTDIYLREQTTGKIILDNFGYPIIVGELPTGYKAHTIPIIHREPPKHPFYVRWINRFGGYDYWMMACKQYDRLQLTETATYEKYWTDTLTTKGDREVYNRKAKHTVKVSTGQCSIDELNELRWLPMSPKIEYQTTPDSPWRTLLIEMSDVELGTAQTSGSIEFECELPTPQLQV